jgi:two-component system sensor histidine kinase EvgS
VSGPPRESTPHTLRPLNILIVDDHPANRLLLFEQLCFLGHHCEMAVNGAQGLQRWRNGDFDLVIADCNMPVMNGYDLTRGIRDQERDDSRAHCTVLGFTANAQTEEIQRCREAGMDDCLFKPISLTALNDRLSKVSPLSHLAPAQDPEAFAPDSITALTGGREGMSRRLIEQLIVSNVDDRQELAALMPEGNRQLLRDIGHKIRGAARIISARHVIQMCEALEHACDEDASDQVIVARVTAVDSALQKLEHALRVHLEKQP